MPVKIIHHMKWSLSLGRISGIEVFVHWTFLILIGWILFSHINMGHGWEQSLVGVVFILVSASIKKRKKSKINRSD